MLDNFESENLKSCAKSLKQKWTDKKFLLESSGGITDENITEYFCPGMYCFYLLLFTLAIGNRFFIYADLICIYGNYIRY